MPSPPAGATAPLRTAIELQVEHLRTVNRMSRSATLEAVFPMWTHGVIRSDLSRRRGVDMLSVTNAQINAWFTQRGVSPQFVYDWQDLRSEERRVGHGGVSPFRSRGAQYIEQKKLNIDKHVDG